MLISIFNKKCSCISMCNELKLLSIHSKKNKHVPALRVSSQITIKDIILCSFGLHKPRFALHVPYNYCVKTCLLYRLATVCLSLHCGRRLYKYLLQLLHCRSRFFFYLLLIRIHKIKHWATILNELSFDHHKLCNSLIIMLYEVIII